MKKNDIHKMLNEWGTTSSASIGPFPSSKETPEDVEDLATNGGDTNSGSLDLTTNIPGPSDPENIPGPDKKIVNIKEADEQTKKPTPAPIQKPKPVENGTYPPEGVDPSMTGVDPNMAGVDPSMVGMGMQVGPTNSQEVGRVYELKKIYSRLVSMQSYLSGSTDINLVKLKSYVANTMDLFRTLISNVTLYKDNLDDIIIAFYKVVNNIYMILSKYYKDNTTGNNKMVQAIE